MGLIFGTMHLVKKFKLDDPEYVQYIQGLYGAATCLLLALSYYFKAVAESKNDQTPLEYDEPQLGQGSTHVVTTVKEHDLKEITKNRNTALTTAAVVVFMYWKFQFIQPMILQSILPVFNLIKTPLFQVYLLGKPATGELARPWRPENPFASAQPSAQEAAPEARSDSPSRIEEVTESESGSDVDSEDEKEMKSKK
ncbi:phosphate transporter (Pho88) [Mycoemilia scoparia]|uniref:Phosphate transporter (Pho88) n=1 Tax=Mycoemilia scoparia TaxID=417184 RepID=A0A9W8A1L6_9FUNG|nr:phosphate transporter (Pho88) [Mycoemilia scoparia]